ncbi:MAG: hypothetical protein BGO10_03390 [Chlamydia sp. 32-24]|nr:MAG: hypothetical protein BGO10_03390 [Chlamydia sp. 32-24]
MCLSSYYFNQEFSKVKGELETIFSIKFSCYLESTKEQTYEFSYTGKNLKLSFSSYNIGLFALNNLKLAIKGKKIFSVLGRHFSEVENKILMLNGTYPTKVEENLFIFLPPIFCSSFEEFETFCLRIVEIGYNSIIFTKGKAIEIDKDIDLQWMETFKKFGIKVFFKFFKKNEEKNFVNCFDPSNLSNFLSKDFVKGVFWEATSNFSDAHQKYFLNDCTYLDLIKDEISSLQNTIPKNIDIIYQISIEPIKDIIDDYWLKQLCCLTSKRCTVAYSWFEGDFLEEYKSENFFIKFWKYNLYSHHYRFYPLLNTGSINLGEGLWPVIRKKTYELVHKSLNNGLKGFIAVSNGFPQKYSFLDFSLWLNACASWKSPSINYLFDLLITIFNGDAGDDFVGWFEEVEKYVLKLNWIKSLHFESQREQICVEEYKMHAEIMVVKLKELENNLIKILDKKEKNDIYHYFTFFKKDAKRILLNFSHFFRLPNQNFIQEEDTLTSFWSEFSSLDKKTSQEIRFFEKPNIVQQPIDLKSYFYKARLF